MADKRITGQEDSDEEEDEEEDAEDEGDEDEAEHSNDGDLDELDKSSDTDGSDEVEDSSDENEDSSNMDGHSEDDDHIFIGVFNPRHSRGESKFGFRVQDLVEQPSASLISKTRAFALMLAFLLWCWL
jgi:hypothetical protein